MAKINTVAKATAQTSKMSKTSTTSITAAAPKSKFEIFGEGICKYVSDHKDCVSQVEGKQEWILKAVDLGKGPSDFRVKIEEGVSKSGRKWCKREMYRINGEKETLVQFGTLKKKYLYKLMLHLVKGDSARQKNVLDPVLVKKVASAIRADRSAFKLVDGSITGAIKDVGDIKYTESEKVLKTGKKVQIRQLFIDGALKLEGVQLGSIPNAFKNTGRSAKKMADIMAEGEASIADLV